MYTDPFTNGEGIFLFNKLVLQNIQNVKLIKPSDISMCA